MILATNYFSRIAVLDACVLYPAALRDLLLNLARSQLGLYKPVWTLQIQEKWIYNLLKNCPDLKRGNLARTIDAMNGAFPDALVVDYESLINKILLPDLNDRHILAAAIKANARTIITYNIKDFPEIVLQDYKIKVMHPDEFISYLLTIDLTAVYEAVKLQRSFLKNPVKTIDELLAILQKQGLTKTVL